MRECSVIACSRLSDSGEDAKVKGTRKVGGSKKRKRKGAALPLPSFLPFYFRLRAFAIQQALLFLSLEQDSSIMKSIADEIRRQSTVQRES